MKASAIPIKTIEPILTNKFDEHDKNFECKKLNISDGRSHR
jgi:hypothetical protein